MRGGKCQLKHHARIEDQESGAFEPSQNQILLHFSIVNDPGDHRYLTHAETLLWTCSSRTEKTSTGAAGGRRQRPKDQLLAWVVLHGLQAHGEVSEEVLVRVDAPLGPVQAHDLARCCGVDLPSTLF